MPGNLFLRTCTPDYTATEYLTQRHCLEPCSPWLILCQSYLRMYALGKGLVEHLEKEMATHSSVLAWRIPGMGEPGGLLSMGSHSWTRLKRLSSSSSSGTLTTLRYSFYLFSAASWEVYTVPLKLLRWVVSCPLYDVYVRSFFCHFHFK